VTTTAPSRSICTAFAQVLPPPLVDGQWYELAADASFHGTSNGDAISPAVYGTFSEFKMESISGCAGCSASSNTDVWQCYLTTPTPSTSNQVLRAHQEWRDAV
jgi:hypothetical protein